MLRGTLCVLFGSLILLGCAGAIRLQPLPADHPANHEAPEAPMQAAPRTLREGPEGSSVGSGASPREHPMDHEHMTGSEGQTTPSAAAPESPEEAVYSCPMHPDVKASAPGRCPECGMALIREGAK